MTNPGLTLHAKQPKHGMAAFEKGFLEILEYPRADRAVITWTEDGRRETLEPGSSADALRCEIRNGSRFLKECPLSAEHRKPEKGQASLSFR